MNHGDMHPGFAALGAFFIVFAQPSASAQPSQGAFHHPPPGQDLKVVAVRFALDHGQQLTARSPSPRHQSARVASICPDHLQSGESTQQFGQHQPGTVPILDAGSMNHHGQQQSHGVHHDVPLASGYPFASVVTPRPPFSVVFTDWLSMIAALGVASRPATSRTRTRKASSTRSQVPSSRHFRKYHQTVPQGGRSWGISRQGMPPRSTYRMPLTTSRRSVVLGMASFGVGRQQGSQFGPLGIGQIAGIRFSAHAPSVTTIPSSPQEQRVHV